MHSGNNKALGLVSEDVVGRQLDWLLACCIEHHRPHPADRELERCYVALDSRGAGRNCRDVKASGKELRQCTLPGTCRSITLCQHHRHAVDGHRHQHIGIGHALDRHVLKNCVTIALPARVVSIGEHEGGSRRPLGGDRELTGL